MTETTGEVTKDGKHKTKKQYTQKASTHIEKPKQNKTIQNTQKTDRQTDRQTETQKTQKQTKKQTSKQASKQTNTHTQTT